MKKPIKAQVSASMTNGLWSVRRNITAKNAIPCAVIAAQTRQQAQQIVKFARLDEKEMIACFAFTLDETAWLQKEKHPYSDEARCDWAAVNDKSRALLQLTGLLAKGKRP